VSPLVLPEVVVDVQNTVAEGKIPADSAKHVSVGDLDLSTVPGACMALKRIRSAADGVCPYEDRGTLNLASHRQQCLNDSVMRAVQATHSAQLEALRIGPSSGCFQPELAVYVQPVVGGKLLTNSGRRAPMGDLDLSTVAGACTALKRIRGAAGEVCPFEGAKEMAQLSTRQHCVNDSIARAVQAMHSTQMEALRSGQSPGC
jgi:UrcA family protein